MDATRLAFIGGGNMARSLIGGLIADGFPKQDLSVAEPDAEKRRALEADFGVRGFEQGPNAIQDADIVVLAVKPQVVAQVAQGLAPTIARRRPLVISIAAGISTDLLARWLGAESAIVRAMPNTPALVKSGATALVANAEVSEAQRDAAEQVLRAVGLTLWLDDEAQMDAVTALSGSGPAYLFLVMEAMERAGVGMGLRPEVARLLTLQTAFGAAKMALESAEDAAHLRARVTSPGGTTERAIEVLQQGDLPGLFERALQAARDRARELAELLGRPNG